MKEGFSFDTENSDNLAPKKIIDNFENGSRVFENTTKAAERYAMYLKTVKNNDKTGDALMGGGNN